MTGANVAWDTGNRPVVFDDVGASLRQMTLLGQRVMSAIAGRTRKEIVVSAALLGWSVLPHDVYEAWAMEIVRSADRVWLILDPLIDGDDQKNCWAVRLTRALGKGGWELEGSLTDDVKAAVAGRLVGIVDDAVATGTTLQYLCRLVGEAGGIVSEFVIGSAKYQGRRTLTEAVPGATWYQYLC